MSNVPKLALVGRPNVGKSALFNAMSGKRIAIVDEAEGITRDRLYTHTDVFGHPVELIDTGGIDPRSKALFNELVKRQAEIAIEEADTLVMVVDAHIGATALDHEVARILQTTDKPLCLAVNKVDNREQEILLHEFHSLGIPNMVAVSASQRYQIAELLEVALKELIPSEVTVEDRTTKLAIVGRANVGKSTLLNQLLDEDRTIVSPIPGTTRDSIDAPIEHNGIPYTLIDTAGIRRKHAEHEVVDKFAAIRSERAIERSDICLLVLDAREGMTHQEKRIAKAIEKEGKSCILLFNKWDLVKGFRMEHCLQEVRNEIPFLKHCPAIFMSALTGRNTEKIFGLVEEVDAARKQRITTGQLNRVIASAMQAVHPPMIRGKRLRVYYLTQVGICPPRFVLFVNKIDLMADSYERYLYNQLRETYCFSGAPITINMRGKVQRKAPTGGREQTPSLEDVEVNSL